MKRRPIADKLPATPPSIHDFAGLATIAEHLRDARAAGGRKQVESGRLTEADAADRLRVATALAADWRRVADRTPRPEPIASQAELIAMLQGALPNAIIRRDRAWTALIEGAPQYRRHESAELWALSDQIDAFSDEVRRDIEELVRPWLSAESVANGLAAMLWWQQRTGTESIHWLIEATMALRMPTQRKGEGRLAA